MEFNNKYPAALAALSLLVGTGHLAAKPPAAAFSACSGASTGQSCAVQTPHGKLSGQCRQPPQEQSLVCVPEGHRGPGGREDGRAGGPGGSPNGGPPGGTREHTVVQSPAKPQLLPADTSPITSNESDEMLLDQWRVITANGVSEHDTGAFPNRGNPNAIREQQYVWRVAAAPTVKVSVTPLARSSFGVTINGVPFDPGAAEWYKGVRSERWQYEPLAGAIALGLDANYAHVQPNGAYHYHGLPSGLLADIELSSSAYSPLVGWAADGFPIYALYGAADDGAGGVVRQLSSYRLRSGSRPSAGNNPGGRYDGTFVGDYEYVENSGTLDECNGRWAVTPEFPGGGYVYFLTEQWPVIPRCHRGTPSQDFSKRR